MNPRVLAALAVVAIVGGGVAYVLLQPAPEPASVEVTSRPAPAPAPPPIAPTPPPVAAAPEPAARAEPSRRPPAPAPAPAAPAEPAAPTTAMLFIDSDVPGAQVFVDRNFVGAAPATAPDIAPGSHVVNVTAPGFEGVSTRIDAKPGPMNVVVKLREVRLDATLEVVHKHRMGNCTGKLIATPNGLRYETTDKEDAFTTSLLELETFEVDYMAKNLRLKSVKGKRFDFTDPQGNADRLFVFQRDVAKARDRLKKGDPPAASQ